MFWRHIQEGVKNLFRNSWMTFASISAVAATLLILGVTLVISLNAQQMTNYVTGQLEISAYLQTSVSKTQAEQIVEQVKALPGVKSVQYISKEEGFKILEQEIGKQYQDVLQELSKSNPLPDKLVVKPKDPAQLVGVSQEIKTLPGIARVDDGQQIVDKLLHFLSIVRNIGLVFVAGLIVMAMFLISNTIKITIFSRRREIEIMKLVGATNWFIRWPFLTEGIIIGTIGALLPYTVIALAYQNVFDRFGGAFLALTFPLLPTVAMTTKLAEVLFGLGIIIGIWGGIMSVRKFLRA